MTARHIVTDTEIERMLRGRSAAPHSSLLSEILAAVDATPQQRGPLLRAPWRLSWRGLALVGLLALMAALGGAAILGSPPRPTPPPSSMSRYHHNGSILVLDTGLPRQVVDIGSAHTATRVAIPYVGGVDRISWAPDGMHFAYASANQTWIADLATASTRRLFDCQSRSLLRTCLPAWSPDGTAIAVTYWGGLRGGLRLFVPDGQPIASFSLTSEPIDSLAWSPDGGRIAFATSEATNRTTSTMYVVNRDGTGLRELPDAAAPQTVIFDVAWSPDGSRVAYINSSTWSESSGWTMSLVGIAPDGSGRAVIADAGACFCLGWAAGGLAWSPDGQAIAFGKPGEGLFLIGQDGSNLRKIDDAWESPAWRPIP